MTNETTASTIPASILSAAVGLILPYAPSFTVSELADAINQSGEPSKPQIEKPLTRREAAALLGVSMATLGRWQAAGKLHTIHLSRKVVRISPDSVRALIGA